MRLNKGIKYIFILCFCLLGNSLVKAQDDSLALPYPQMLFSNPGNFSQNIEYNLTSKDFTFNNTIGTFQSSRPTFMSESAYKNGCLISKFKIFGKLKSSQT